MHQTPIKMASACLERGCGEGFLADLAPSIPRLRYTGITDFLHAYDALSETNVSEWLLLTDIDESTFTRDFENATDDSHIAFWLWVSLDPLSRLLLFKMPPLPAHEVALSTFGRLFDDSLQATGLKYAIKQLGSSPYGEGNRGRKRADCEWAPKRPPPGHDRNAPTVVLEVALTETRSKLNSDVRFWLDKARHDVNIALTLDIDQREPRITIEKWELVQDKIHRTQRVVIHSNNQRPVVTGGPLTIDFMKLFLRAPTTPKEMDIVIEVHQLEFLAEEIWETQDTSRE
jgi:hypothetical protein